MFDYTILGAGAIGCVYGGLLSAAGHRVQLVTRSPDLGRKLKTSPLIIDLEGEMIEANPTACQPADVGDSRVVIVLTKAFHMAQAVHGVHNKFGPDAIWLTLQNGLGNSEALGDIVGRDNVFHGPAMMPARIVKPGHISMMAALPTMIGPMNPKLTQKAEAIAMDLTEAGIPTELTADVAPFVWQKAIFNLGMNAISTLTIGGPGLIGAAPGLMDEAIATAMEGADVAASIGIKVDREQVVAMMHQVGRDHLWHPTSMRIDVENGRPTEIASLNGYVSAKGKEVGVPTPRNDLLTAMIRAREMSVSYWQKAPSASH